MSTTTTASYATDVNYYLRQFASMGEEHVRELWRIANTIAHENQAAHVRAQARVAMATMEQAAAQWKADQDELAMNAAVQVRERQDDARAYAAKAARDAAPAPAPPQARASRATGAVEDGMYRTPDGTIYKVQKAVHGLGHLYAKVLIVEQEPVRDAEGTITTPAKVRFDYAAGMVRRLRPEWKLTKEQAQAFGALYGTCVRCGRTLTREDSIARMMGRTCAGLMGW